MQSCDSLRVLFIDDEVDVLHGINRAVRGRCPGWTLHFASSPLEAFRILHACPGELDVVVCDMQLPYLSGEKILKFLCDSFEPIVRITLSGRLDGESLRGSNRYSECHVCKPVHADVLCERIVETYRKRYPIRHPA